jgi:hypothetical protein
MINAVNTSCANHVPKIVSTLPVILVRSLNAGKSDHRRTYETPRNSRFFEEFSLLCF